MRRERLRYVHVVFGIEFLYGGVEWTNDLKEQMMNSGADDNARPKWYQRRGVRLGALVVGLPVLVVGWWLVSPLFLNKTVVEEFPRALAAQVPEGRTLADVEAEMLSAESEGKVVEEEMPVPDSTVVSVAEPVVSAAEPVVSAAEPVLLVSGQFSDGDSFHRGSGDVGVYEFPDGSRILRLEDIDITNGPDLHVILSPVSSAENRDDVMTSGYVDLGSLKGNRGSQNYDIPPEVDFSSGTWTAIVYCVPFHAVFATAPLS